MCGIAGTIDWSASTTEDGLRTVGTNMAAALKHRGPDGEKIWIDAKTGTVLAHRRLAVIDLGSRADQPMHSADGRYVIVFNGEIFNYRDIRLELEGRGRQFRTQSDTEVLIEACVEWGVLAAVKRCIGMFAFGLWDRQSRTLSLVRDRLGIKPLYYAERPERVMFASQLRAFHHAPGWAPTLDADAIAGFLRHAYIAQPRTVYREAAKLPPGHILTIRQGTAPELHCYWDLRAVARDGGRRANAAQDHRDVADRLDALLRDAVRLRLISDVSLGAFLSGGVDSSTVVALMQAQSTRPVKTFSIGFEADDYDETNHAHAVARHLGTDHTSLYVDPKQTLETIPNIPEWFDEPFGDSSQIVTYLIAKMARHEVTVSLSGDGGDEVFAGYNRHVWASRLARDLDRFPLFGRQIFRNSVLAFSPATLDWFARAIPAAWRPPPQTGDKLHKAARFGAHSDMASVYRAMVSQWDSPQELMASGREPRGLIWDGTVSSDFPDPTSRMQFLDMAAYLPDDILAKVDRATMAVGLEARVPLLDHRVVEYAWSLPVNLKVRNGQGKRILRKVLERYVPTPLTDRPKAGFAMPIDSWLRGPLRDWAESLLDPSRLAADGLLEPAPVQQAWKEHLSGRRNWQQPLWTVLMLQAWRERWT